MHYAENISYDEFTSIYELPADTTIWRIFNTGEQTIYWSEYEKPPSKGEKSYHTLFAHSAEVPVTIPSQIYVKRSDQNSSPRVEILWTRSKEANDMARVAGGLHIGKQIVTTTSGRGIETEISGETVIAKISGEAVRVSGETVIVAISGETVIAKVSGEATYPHMKKTLGTPSIQPLSCYYSGVLSVELVQHDDGGLVEPIESDRSNKLKVAMSGDTVRQAMQQSYVSGVLGADMTVGSGATEAVASPVVVDVEEQDVIAVECRATSVGLAGATGEVIFALQRAMISGDFESLVSGDYYPCIVYSPLNSEYTRRITRVPVEGVKCVQIGQVLNEVNANLSGVNATIGLNR